jgi:hypothetical protein
MGISLYYDFQECQCLNTTGQLVTIPAGRYVVTELSSVTVVVGSNSLDLEKNAFNQLKAQRKVNIPLG